MQYLYIATVFAGALVCLLASLLLFARRKTGERSRIILAVIVSFSVYNYIMRFIALCNGSVPEMVVSTKLLLQANFMVISYIMYPIEVIAPGWLNFWRTMKLYSAWLFLLCVYLISLWAGVEYTSYNSLLEMFAHSDRFEVWFRLLLCFLIFSPILFIFFIHRTRIYRNSNRIWVRKYVFAFIVNIVAYLLILVFNYSIFHTIYYYISVGCSLYIVYMELFDRLISASNNVTIVAADRAQMSASVAEYATLSLPTENFSIESKAPVLIERLDVYMRKRRLWRDPDLSLSTLASELCTNRTSLAKAMRENGYGNYTSYINKLRIEDFLQQIKPGQSSNFQETFFEVGFRSRSTALRNFRQYTGMTPSEYLQKKDMKMDENLV